MLLGVLIFVGGIVSCLGIQEYSYVRTNGGRGK
jgi:hypothetical protein